MKKRKLTVKQIKLIKGIAEGKTMTRAGLDAGYGSTPDSARISAYQALQKPMVASALEAALDKMGATVEKSARVLAEAHDAKETKFFQREGQVIDERVVVDHQTRLKAAELALRARKLIGAPGETESGGTVNLTALIAVIKNVSSDRGLPL